jgi:hypothetical protein
MARLQLKCEYTDNRVSLAVYMATMLHDAVADLYKLNPYAGQDVAELSTRFIGWTQRTPHDHR